MQRLLLNFLLVFAAVLVALFAYRKLSGNKSPVPSALQQVQDFGVGELRARKQALSEGFRMVDGVKTAFAEYYSNLGKMPTSNQDLQLASPESYHGQSVTSIAASEHGIIVTYNEKSGVDGGRIVFTPLPNDGMVQWKCATSSYPDIKTMIPACDYQSDQAQ